MARAMLESLVFAVARLTDCGLLVVLEDGVVVVVLVVVVVVVVMLLKAVRDVLAGWAWAWAWAVAVADLRNPLVVDDLSIIIGVEGTRERECTGSEKKTLSVAARWVGGGC